MRAAAIVLVLALLIPSLASVAAHHSPTHPILHRTGTAPGWSLDTFTAPRDLISFSIGIGYDGEFAAQLIHLYNADGALLAGFLMTYEGGRDPDVMVTAGDLTVEQNLIGGGSSYPIAEYSLRCDNACSPNREFRVLAVSAGDVDLWGYAVFSPTAVAGATRNGTSAGAMRTTSFEGVAADATIKYNGVVASALSTHTITTVDGMIGAFGKPSFIGPIASSAQTPTGTQTCFCIFADNAPGAYTFSYTDVDALATPGVLVWADVDL